MTPSISTCWASVAFVEARLLRHADIDNRLTTGTIDEHARQKRLHRAREASAGRRASCVRNSACSNRSQVGAAARAGARVIIEQLSVGGCVAVRTNGSGVMR